MKSILKYFILLPILLINFSCEDDPASSTDCAALTAASSEAATAYLADPTNSPLCAETVTTYKAALDAGCDGFTVAGDSTLQAACDMLGCIDAYACNYNAAASIDNSTCTYAATGQDCDGNALAIVGTWDLSALTGKYIRDVAQPATTDPASYALTASWNYAADVLGADAANADQVITTFSVGDTVLNRESALPTPAAIAAVGVAMTGVYNDQNVYTLTGTYPTLRLDEDACNTYQTVAQITDQGYYGVVYNDDNTGGTMTITPDVSLGDQVLPPFDDAVITFLNSGNTLNIQFEDRDAHDVDYAEVMDTWTESSDRVTMGVAMVPYDPATGAFTTVSDTTASSGYLMSTQLTTWGGYMTWNALQYNGCLAAAAAEGGDGTTCQTSHAAYLLNDSADEFDITCVGDGNPSDCSGKLTYNVNGLCMPINEIILFDATFEKTAN